MSAILTPHLDPGAITILKGNKPLNLRINRKYRVVLYASEPEYIEAVLDSESGWDLVHGELITFTDPLRDLPPVGWLEGFNLSGRSLYQRVLVAVRTMNGLYSCRTLPGT